MKTTKVLPFCNNTTFECFEVVDPPLLPNIRVTRPRCSSNHATCSSSLPRVLVTIAILSLCSLTLNKLGQPGLDSQHEQPPRQRLHFLEKASRRVCASHAAHWQDRRRRRRGSTSPPPPPPPPPPPSALSQICNFICLTSLRPTISVSSGTF